MLWGHARIGGKQFKPVDQIEVVLIRLIGLPALKAMQPDIGEVSLCLR